MKIRASERPLQLCRHRHRPLPFFWGGGGGGGGLHAIKQGDEDHHSVAAFFDVHMQRSRPRNNATSGAVTTTRDCGRSDPASISPNVGVYATEPMADPIGEWNRGMRPAVHCLSNAKITWLLGGHKLPLPVCPPACASLIEKPPRRPAPSGKGDCRAQNLGPPNVFDPVSNATSAMGEYGMALVESGGRILANLYRRAAPRGSLRAQDGAWV